MEPTQLTAEQFSGYPAKARALAANNLALLRQLPLSFVPFLLREIVGYDWKFPVEQREFDSQLTYLNGMTAEQREHAMARFAKLQLDPKIESFDWVNSPAQFLEQLSAHLWATHQTDEFRAASEEYVHNFYAALPKQTLPVPRLGIAVIGQDVTANQYSLFRKLRRSGVYFNQVNPANGLQAILETVKARAADYPARYGHWYVDGGTCAASLTGVTAISYDELTPVRSALAEKMRIAYEAPKFDPELLRTNLARTTPESVGLTGSNRDAVIDRFDLSLLTEGSGTQIYSTTFVQWAAREALRRAQPLTLLTRYAPRQRERPMNELLSGTQHKSAADPQGSLIDGDMGAYYTWLNQQRLSGAGTGRFLVWFEGHNEALAIAPGLKAATTDSSTIDVAALLRTVA